MTDSNTYSEALQQLNSKITLIKDADVELIQAKGAIIAALDAADCVNLDRQIKEELISFIENY